LSDVWERVRDKLAEHEYMFGVERTVSRIKATGEVFTPSELVIEMVRAVPIERFGPGQTVLDPACGDGQFLVAAKWIKVFHFGMSESDALADVFGVDIMRDNVDICRRRLGGGTILMGDALRPAVRLDGQTDGEHELMMSLFAPEATTTTRKKTSGRPRKGSRRSGETLSLGL
jgi:SAM-dependent methyltransferase